MSDEAENLVTEIQALLAEGRKIEGIKRYREATGAGLAAAKEMVEAIERGEPLPERKPVDSTFENEIVGLLEGGKKIEAIKRYRERTGGGLKEAKDAVEAVAAQRGIVAPSRSGCLGVVLLLIAISVAALAMAGEKAVRGEPAAVPSSQRPTLADAVKADLVPFTHSPDFFPILPWDVLHLSNKPLRSAKNGLESIAECNFTVAGFVRLEDLPLCEKLGLVGILTQARKWKDVPDDEIDGRVKQMAQGTANNRSVLGYYIKDEPGASLFPKLGKIVAAVKKYAPGKLAYINLLPSYATKGAPDTSQLGTATYTEYLEMFVNEVKPQFISYDNYMVQYSDDMQEPIRAANYYADLLEIRRVSQKYGLPFWNIVSCDRIGSQSTIPSPSNLAFQAYTTLAAGGRGVTWFKYYQDQFAYAPIDNAGEKTETWRYLQVVNKQVRVLGPILNHLRSTGVFFTSPPPVKPLPLLPGRIVKTVQSKASPRGLIEVELPLMVGEFTDENGTDFVMVVNLSLEKSANIKLDTVKPYKTRQVFSSEDGRLLLLDEENGHWLLAGNGVLVRLE
jgi:ribosomal protein L7/L12